MEYRRFGKTDMNVSVLTLGLMRYMSDDADKSAEVVRRAVEYGVNHFDTARGYGTSEELLGHALKSIDRSKVYITSKIGVTDSYDEFMRAFETSLTKMGIDVLDVLDVHGINNRDKLRKTLDEKEYWRGVRKVLDDGSLRHIGFSTHGPTNAILDAINTGCFESVSLHCYWFHQANWPAIARASELDMGVLIISPNEKGGMLYDPTPRLKQLAAPIHPMHLNARWLLSKPEVHTLTFGPIKAADVDLHMQVADQAGPLTPEEQAAIDRWDAHCRSTLGRDYCTVCGECLPCPEFVNIPEVLRLRNVVCAFDMTNYGRFRYNFLHGGNDWFQGHQGDRCTECGLCLPRCPEKLDIPRLLFDAHDALRARPGRRLWG